MARMSLPELNDALAQARTDQRAAEKLFEDLREVKGTVLREQDRLAELRRVLAKEKRDLDRVEGKGLVGLFYAVLGADPTQVAQERREYLAARLSYEQCESNLAFLESERTELERRLAALGQPEPRYRQLLQRKEELLRQDPGEGGRRLLAVTEELTECRGDEKELREALDAGREVLTALEEARRHLASASRWGTLDLLGGRKLVSLQRNLRVDQGRAAVAQVQSLLLRFQRELADVGRRLSFVGLEAPDVGSFMRFADIFYDGLIADWIVQSKVTRARQSVATATEPIQRLYLELQTARDRVRERRDGLERQRLALLEQA